MFEISNFLDNNGFSLDIDRIEIVNNFIKQMKNKLEGNNSSLGMLCSYIKTEHSLKLNEKVIVIDAGGTNLRISALYFNENKVPIIEGFTKLVMPGVEKQVSKDEFYKSIAEALLPFEDYSSKIGFCFSYPVELQDSSDGIILRMCKEIKAPEVVGTHVCKSLNEKILELGGKNKEFILLNDSTSTLLAGYVSKPNMEWDGYIGFILGTGSNSCYIDDYIINVESGWYDGIPRGKYDIQLDEESINPGSYFMEKATSGAYLGSLATYIFKDLMKKGYVRSDVSELSTKSINDFLINPESSLICSIEDIPVFKEVIDRIIERSALYVAINLVSLIIKGGKGSAADRPVCIAADGSTFYNLVNYRKRVSKYMDEMLSEKYYYQFVKVDNAPVVGAAVASLTN